MSRLHALLSEPGSRKIVQSNFKFLLDFLNLSVDKMHPEPSPEERISCLMNCMLKIINGSLCKETYEIYCDL